MYMVATGRGESTQVKGIVRAGKRRLGRTTKNVNVKEWKEEGYLYLFLTVSAFCPVDAILHQCTRVLCSPHLIRTSHGLSFS